MGLRTTLHDRLAVELLDTEVAGAVTQLLDNDTVAAINAMCDHAIATSPALSYRPSQRPGDQIDAVVAFSYGYRITPTPGHPASDIPPMEALSPGPVNELLAAEVAAFAAVRPMPIIAQWEIARVLDSCGVSNVISVEPDVSEDGTTVYLSTAGVLDKGLRLATATGLRPQCIGVVAHLDHARVASQRRALTGLMPPSSPTSICQAATTLSPVNVGRETA